MSLCIISAPSSLGLWPSGVQDLGRTLLGHGLGERLSAPLVREIVPAVYVREKDDVTGYLNGPAIRAMALEMAQAVSDGLADGHMPLILGGDCSVLHGALLALRRVERPGLFYMDGHADFYDGAGTHSGEVADMGLAIATGHNHGLLSDIDGLSPYVRPTDAVCYGFRDEREAAADGSPSPRGTGIGLFDLGRLRRQGTDACLAEAVRLVSRPDLGRIWVHFDTDVIDNALNPAVDYPLPSGLHWEEAVEAIAAIRATGRMAGLSVTIFNPRKDLDGRIAMALTDGLVAALTRPI
ncbi:MAG: arginase family protein [Labrys sp. (in: a-proteobacteria)]|jgi:arginase